MDLRHTAPEFRTYAGDGALAGFRRELDRIQSTRVAVLAAPALGSHPAAMKKVEHAVDGISVGTFSRVEQHSPLPAVLAARDFLAEAGADAVVAVGGGSVVVTARAASILLAEAQDIRQLCTRRKEGRLVSPRLAAPKLPLWIVATTPTTAYAKAGSAVRDTATGERLALYDPKTRARGVIFDPDMALTAPTSLMQSASLNALSMSVEGLRAEGQDPLADAYLSQALRDIVHWLPEMDRRPDDSEPRLRLMIASLMSGQGSDFVPAGLAQGLSHALGPRSGAPNGVLEAILVPTTTRRATGVTHFPLLASVVGASGGSSDLVAVRLLEVLAELGVPSRLRDVIVDERVLPEVATHAVDDWAVGGSNPGLRAEDLLTLLKEAW